jgi:hypothetical protein
VGHDRASVDELERRRAFRCRLSSDRALTSFEEAVAFLSDRRMLTRTSDCRLPSLFEACHEEPYAEAGRGFASWPRSTWWWAAELEQLPEVTVLKIHRGKNLMMTRDVLTLVDPICRAELARLTPARPRSAQEKHTARLLDHLAATGPATPAALKEELGLHSRELRAIRHPLERCGALVSRATVESAPPGRGRSTDGHLHSSVVARYDQIAPEPLSDMDVAAAIEELVVAGVDAAVLADERDVRRWFSWTWYLGAGLLDRLVAGDRIIRPGVGFVATTT